MRFLEYVKIFVEWGLRVSQYVSPSQKGKVPSQFACRAGEGKFNPMKKRIDGKDSSWSSYQNEGWLNKDKDEDLVNYCVCPKSKNMNSLCFAIPTLIFWKTKNQRLVENWRPKIEDLWKTETMEISWKKTSQFLHEW